MSKSRSDLLRELGRVANNINKGPQYLEVVETSQTMIAEEFKSDFLEIILENNFSPRQEFLEYWEKDENCQRAMRLALGFIAERTDKLAHTMFTLAYLPTTIVTP